MPAQMLLAVGRENARLAAAQREKGLKGKGCTTGRKRSVKRRAIVVAAKSARDGKAVKQGKK